MAAAGTSMSKSAAIRARLKHPVIDSDGHTIEFSPAIFDYLKKVGGNSLVDRFKGSSGRGSGGGWHRLTPEERRERRATRPPWWAFPTTNTLDRATATLPRLLYERMDQFGLDFTVLYPTLGLFAAHLEDEELRRGSCRAYNLFHAELFSEFPDRMTPVAVIPMHTPAEAIDELEFAVGKLGMKATMMAGHVRRPVPLAAQKAPKISRWAFWIDNLALDSEYDYDPVWAKCVELGVAPTFHSSSMGWGSRSSINNYMYNHIGHFAAAGEAICKALFMGGVTRRFPTLKFAFLEGGVGWACNLYSDLIGHWMKRNRKDITNYDPANLDRAMFQELCRRYGNQIIRDKLDQRATAGERFSGGNREDPAMLDEWAPCGIEQAADIRDLFVPNFYFGCEADDPMNAWAFNSKVNPFGARLNAIFSSDIGHWDVPDMTEVTEEAYELVEHGLIGEEDFRDFVFTHPARLWTGMNPNFFKGTVVESDVNKLVARA
ncbi:MAG: amidohydrolase family protein [Candidatus Binataceae bacterium]